ncbi:MAG: pyridoxamine 5'-phosphate oxidase family protein [Planctomycetes bacterium]|nr:pyridoxamine 5'-phosphate oxidase family protein [Planctomycetota bacterium]
MGQVDIAEFLKRGLCVLVGTRDASLMPHCVTGSAVVLAGPGRGVVFLPSFESAPALANLLANGGIAVLVEEPTTHRGIQLKGEAAAMREATLEELRVVAEFVARTKAELSAIGFAPTVLERMNFTPCTAVEFTFDRVFEQTPGPGAGRPVEVRA